MKNIIIISVGGSLIVPDNIDIAFLRKFRALILRHIKNGKRFVIICGGGKTCRRYQEAAKAVANLTKGDVDWLGIHATRLNAHLLRSIFRDYANPRIINNPTEKISFSESLLIAAGWKPGFSTDFDAVMIAKSAGAKKIVNLTDVDYVYDKDPKKHKDARPVRKISWHDFRKLLPKKWDPGLSAPFDPVASRKAEKMGLEVAIINGKNLKNLDNYLNGKNFVGTIIKD